MKDLLFTKKKTHFKEGEIIFEEGEEAEEMFFIDSGRVKIVKKAGDDDVTLVILDEDDFFGEMALITGNNRIASAIALSDCKIHTMDKETFDSNLANDKIFTRKIVETLALRLEATDLKLKRHLQRTARLSKTYQITG